MKNSNTPLINGIILAAISVYLIWYFSAHGLWNPATVVVLIVLMLLAAGQVIIWFMFFRYLKKNKRKSKKHIDKDTQN